MNDDPLARASDRIEAAHDLIAGGRFEEALESLNEAIVIAPDHPLAYTRRAEVFDELHLAPQAEADRARAQHLASTVGYPVSPIVDGAAQISMRRRGDTASPHRSGGDSPPSQRRAPSGVLTILFVAGIVAALVGAVIIAITAFDDDGQPAFVADLLTVTPTPAPTSTPFPTSTPTAQPSLLSAGSPYSLSSAQTAWSAAGFTVTVGDVATDVSGFAVAAADISITLAGGAIEFAVFVYPDRDAPLEDWDLVVGQRPSPRTGRTVPDHFSVWWNANIVAVVRSVAADSTAALDAFLNMTP